MKKKNWKKAIHRGLSIGIALQLSVYQSITGISLPSSSSNPYPIHLAPPLHILFPTLESEAKERFLSLSYNAAFGLGEETERFHGVLADVSNQILSFEPDIQETILAKSQLNDAGTVLANDRENDGFISKVQYEGKDYYVAVSRKNRPEWLNGPMKTFFSLSKEKGELGGILFAILEGENARKLVSLISSNASSVKGTDTQQETSESSSLSTGKIDIMRLIREAVDYSELEELESDLEAINQLEEAISSFINQISKATSAKEADLLKERTRILSKWDVIFSRFGFHIENWILLANDGAEMEEVIQNGLTLLRKESVIEPIFQTGFEDSQIKEKRKWLQRRIKEFETILNRRKILNQLKKYFKSGLRLDFLINPLQDRVSDQIQVLHKEFNDTLTLIERDQLRHFIEITRNGTRATNLRLREKITDLEPQQIDHLFNIILKPSLLDLVEDFRLYDNGQQTQLEEVYLSNLLLHIKELQQKIHQAIKKADRRLDKATKIEVADVQEELIQDLIRSTGAETSMLGTFLRETYTLVKEDDEVTTPEMELRAQLVGEIEVVLLGYKILLHVNSLFVDNGVLSSISDRKVEWLREIGRVLLNPKHKIYDSFKEIHGMRRIKDNLKDKMRIYLRLLKLLKGGKGRGAVIAGIGVHGWIHSDEDKLKNEMSKVHLIDSEEEYAKDGRQLVQLRMAYNVILDALRQLDLGPEIVVEEKPVFYLVGGEFVETSNFAIKAEKALEASSDDEAKGKKAKEGKAKSKKKKTKKGKGDRKKTAAEKRLEKKAKQEKGKKEILEKSRIKDQKSL